MFILQDYAESTLPSELDDYQTCSEFDFKDDNSKLIMDDIVVFFLNCCTIVDRS